jgi:hypothetical protein
MDEFSLIVLEDTLEFATESLPAELVSDCISGIREYVNTVALDPDDYQSVRKLRVELNQLADIAHQNSKFLVETRLKAFCASI